MTERIKTYVLSQGFNHDDLVFLAKDMSTRQYYRLKGQGLLVMDAPPPEPLQAYIDVAEYLYDLGLRAPRIHHVDGETGLALIEDFGNQTYTQVFKQSPSRIPALYERAMDVLIALHSRAQEKPDFIKTYDTPTLLKEAEVFVDWYYPYVTGQLCPASTKQAYRDAWIQALGALAPTPSTLVLRDYHVDNLMDVAGEGMQACGLLDFQDALWGSVVYDVVSLLEDARIDMDASLRKALWARFTSHLSPLEKQAYEAAYAVLGVCRHFKVLGVFTRYALRAGNNSKLIHLPRLWQYIESNINHPALAEVNAWYAGQRDYVHENTLGHGSIIR